MFDHFWEVSIGHIDYLYHFVLLQSDGKEGEFVVGVFKDSVASTATSLNKKHGGRNLPSLVCRRSRGGRHAISAARADPHWFGKIRCVLEDICGGSMGLVYFTY